MAPAFAPLQEHLSTTVRTLALRQTEPAEPRRGDRWARLGTKKVYIEYIFYSPRKEKSEQAPVAVREISEGAQGSASCLDKLLSKQDAN